VCPLSIRSKQVKFHKIKKIKWIIVSDFLDLKKKRRIIRVFFRNITANF